MEKDFAHQITGSFLHRSYNLNKSLLDHGLPIFISMTDRVVQLVKSYYPGRFIWSDNFQFGKHQTATHHLSNLSCAEDLQHSTSSFMLLHSH